MTTTIRRPGGLYLPSPPAQPEEWKAEAACREADTAVFFQDDRRGSAYYRHARALCRSCPVFEECLAYALGDPSLIGYWATTTAKHRQRIRMGRMDRPTQAEETT